MTADPLDGARWAVRRGDARKGLRALPDASVDLVLTDPPYAEVDRAYGRLTERAWRSLMDGVVVEVRRVLKPTGSAVFILQPNAAAVGSMRPWLWEFIARWARRWNVVQDAYWWNPAAMPTVHSQRQHGLMRPAVKPVVWLGAPDCWRDQAAVLWSPSAAAQAVDLDARAAHRMKVKPSGHHMRTGRAVATALERGGATPMNLLPLTNTESVHSSGAEGHGAGTPLGLAAWWVRYACPPGGLVVDPFAGAGTMGEAALSEGRRFLGIDRDKSYLRTASARCTAADKQPLLFGT